MLLVAGALSVVFSHHVAAVPVVAAAKSSSGGLNLGQILSPLFEAIAGALAFFYSLVSNYAVAIILLTVAIMVILSPLTWKSTRSMIAMQRLAPEMKKLQQKYKGDRETLNQEIMKLYRENGVSPAGGCLPMLLQLPIMYVLFYVVRGLTNTVGRNHIPSPKYISHSSLLYHDLIASHGAMNAFGINLAKSATSVTGGFVHALPYWAIVIVAIGLQYVQMRRLTARNPQASMNSQAQAIQRFTPLIFGFIYIFFQAAVNIYMLVSSLVRLLQQELMYRYDPVVKAQLGTAQGDGSSAVRVSAAVRGEGGPTQQAGRDTFGQRFLEWLRNSGQASQVGTSDGVNKPVETRRDAPPSVRSPAPASGGNGRGAPRDGNRRTGGLPTANTESRSRSHPRSRDKRPRRAR
jgi:YidC/Oxa1 family membrane protein insertase